MSYVEKLGKLYDICSFNTLYFNFHYLPFKAAIRFPFFVSRRCRLRKMGGVINIESDIKAGMIRIGMDMLSHVDNKKHRSILMIEGSLIFAGKAHVGSASTLTIGKGARLYIGNNVSITGRTDVIAFNSIEIGDDSIISWDVQLMDTDFHKIIKNNVIQQHTLPIRIGKKCWIGCKSTVLKGVTLADSTIIAASTTVTKSVSMSGCIIGSNGRIISDNARWIM